MRLTSARRSDEDHADLVGGGRRASSSLLELLDARVKVAQDILKLLQFILDETHWCGCWRLVGGLRDCGGGNWSGEVAE